jgi:hypothetical protein
LVAIPSTVAGIWSAPLLGLTNTGIAESPISSTPVAMLQKEFLQRVALRDRFLRLFPPVQVSEQNEMKKRTQVQQEVGGLGGAEVHVWALSLCFPGRPLSRLAGRLSPDELDHAEKFANPDLSAGCATRTRSR